MKTTIFGNLSKTYKNEGKVEGEILEKITTHLSTTTGNPHKVTARDVGAYSMAEVDEKLDEKAGNNDVYTKVEVDKMFSEVGDSVDAYTKAETDELLSDKADKEKTETDIGMLNFKLLGLPTFNDVYTKGEADEKEAVLVSQLESVMNELVLSLNEMYYTKHEVDSKIGDIDSALDELHGYAASLIGGGA